MGSVSNIKVLRKRIDRLDAQLLRFLNRRAVLARQIGRLKNRLGLKIHDSQRERAVLDHVSTLNRGPLAPNFIQGWFKGLLVEMRRQQCIEGLKPPRIRFKRVGIIGVGMIGGSLARDILALHLSRTVIGYDVSSAVLNRAQRLGVISGAGRKDWSDLRLCDLIIVATPVSTAQKILQTIQFHVNSKALVIDVGSTKQKIIQQAQKGPFAKNFVGCHPLAGSEKSGVASSVDHLFVGKACFVIPTHKTLVKCERKARLFWEALGCSVVCVPAKAHDRVFAVTSHLPQVLSTLLMNAACALQGPKQIKKFIGSGFQSMTRLARSDAEMWTKILEDNRDNVMKTIEGFHRHLMSLKRLVKKSDWAAVRRVFKRAQGFS